MTLRTLIGRSLRFHARAHAGVVLGSAIGSAALIGALLVGESVRESLKDRALSRLGDVQCAMQTRDRFFRTRLVDEVFEPANPGSFACLVLQGVATTPSGEGRANRVNIIGLPESTNRANPFVAAGWGGFGTNQGAGLEAAAARLNETLARQLGVRPGDEIIVRFRKPSGLISDAALNSGGQGIAGMQLKVESIVPANRMGDFALEAQPGPPANLFLPLNLLQEKAGLAGQANLLLSVADGSGAASLNSLLKKHFLPEDAGLSVRILEPEGSARGEQVRPRVELTSSRVFLEPSVVAAATGFKSQNPTGVSSTTNTVAVLAYLANLIRAGERATPYSIVAAAGVPYVPADLREDEILVNEWLTNDLKVSPGSRVELSYYVADSGAKLIERTNSFRVRAVVPMEGFYADRTLMPDFPGVSKAESTRDWEGFPLKHKIREQDEAYWKQYRGTPKAFITLAAGQAMWSNRFGSLTALRYEGPTNAAASGLRDGVRRELAAHLDPAQLGLRFEDVRQQALKAAAESQDFGQLFLGFSFFLVIAALLLMALLFQFGLEQRSGEIGTLLALGFTPGRVRRLLLGEGVLLALLGGIPGALGGWAYGRAMILGLATVWRGAVGESALVFHASMGTVLAGVFAGVAVATLTLWLALRRQVRQPVTMLLSGSWELGSFERKSFLGRRRLGSILSAKAIALGAAAAAAALVGWMLLKGETSNAEAFFSAGALVLVSGVAAVAAWLRRLESLGSDGSGTGRSAAGFSLFSLAVRSCARRRSRSLATVALLACGCFLIVSLGVFRLDANRDAFERGSGTGGFALLGESTLPVGHDLNTRAGREFYNLDANEMTGVEFVQCRLRDGDEASCLNLNRAQKPRLLGVRPESLAGRFTFANVVSGDPKKGWELLRIPLASPEEIPAIGDANSIQWALHKKVGDTLDYVDERGQPFKLRLVGAVANSVLQGSLVIDEAAFTRLFPGESGYRVFLVDAPSSSVAPVTAALTRAMADTGLELTPAARRLNEYNAVQNTYLGTFQVLGGLGLLLGSAGLGIVVLRNVLERRGELGVFVAAGFRRRRLERLVFGEHAALLGLGVALGICAALVAVLPEVLTPGAQMPWGSLGLTLAGVVLNGFLWTWAATRLALRGELSEALRGE